jgi:hypothetical protein
MANDRKPATRIATERESTRRIECECPFGGPNTLNLYRETADLAKDGTLIRLHPEWRRISKSAADVANMTFTRPDGSSFTGLSLISDMQSACDQIAVEDS